MSVKVSSWVWHSDRTAGLRGNAFVAMLALADGADDEGHVRFLAERSQEAIARKARMSVATFRRMMQQLVDDGLLEVTRETVRSENAYRILLTAQSERSQMSGLTAQNEHSDRSAVSGRTPLIRNDVSNVLELVPPGPSEADLFDEFWGVYPRRVGKEAARKAFAAAARKVAPTVILEGARRYAADPNLPEKQFVPHPSTWLSRGSWDDEALPPRAASGGPAAPAAPLTSELDAADSWMAFR